MGFFLSRVWPWWLLAALLALAVTWLLVHAWWSRLDRRHCAPHEEQLEAARARIAEQSRALAAAPTHREPTAAGAAVDSDALVTLRSRLDALEGDGGTVTILNARVAELQAALHTPKGS